MLCNSFQRRKLKKRKETIFKDTKDGPGIQRESFGNNTEVLFVIASSVTSPLIPHNSLPVLRTNTFSNLDKKELSQNWFNGFWQRCLVIG